MEFNRSQILVCAGTGCTSSKSADVREELNKELVKNHLDNQVQIMKTGCFGLCAEGPILVIYPEGIMYHRVGKDDVKEIVEEHLIKGRIVKRLMHDSEELDEITHKIEHSDFFTKQRRVALRNCGKIDPEDINEYIAFDGYKALEKVLTTMTPQGVINVIKDSGLRGRGGGGFPAGTKWQFAADQESDQKYVVCNADEGDPGAFMDRSILEGDPNSIIEAMAISGYAIGANQGYIYVRAEYPIAIERLKIAINQAKEYGLLGDNILGLGFKFDLDMRLGAGAFVCGEETALLSSIEGKRGVPRLRPPFPAVKGLFGKPTIINNVETMANIPVIIRNGADRFKEKGTKNSTGTKVFAVGGKITNTGLVEIPMGTSLREIVYDIGGGVPNGKKFKAAQIGGPSGGCIPADNIDVKIDYDSLKEIGAMMGSGGLIIMDEDTCMVDIAKFFLQFTVDESCGKCTPCRIGNKRMLEILTKITDGRGELQDLEDLRDLAEIISETALCGLGQTAPNPVLSTLDNFYDEYLAHVVDKKCPAGSCKSLISYTIGEDCIGCTKCARVCPVSCISGEKKEQHVIDQSQCIKCGTCFDACPKDAIIRG